MSWNFRRFVFLAAYAADECLFEFKMPGKEAINQCGYLFPQPLVTWYIIQASSRVSHPSYGHLVLGSFLISLFASQLKMPLNWILEAIINGLVCGCAAQSLELVLER